MVSYSKLDHNINSQPAEKDDRFQPDELIRIYIIVILLF